MSRRFKIYGRARRLRELLVLCFRKYAVKCHFCGEHLSERDLPVRATDLLTIHHLDGDRGNDSVDNLVIAHRRCHKAHHLNNNRRVGLGTRAAVGEQEAGKN
jgi:5-methylcytosine-specific restriction endonuclease McrA